VVGPQKGGVVQEGVTRCHVCIRVSKWKVVAVEARK